MGAKGRNEAANATKSEQYESMEVGMKTKWIIVLGCVLVIQTASKAEAVECPQHIEAAEAAIKTAGGFLDVSVAEFINPLDMFPTYPVRRRDVAVSGEHDDAGVWTPILRGRLLPRLFLM